jgi:hypothetical protein
MRRATVVVAILVVGALLAACGGGGKSTTSTTTPTAQDWASGVCSAISTWEAALKSAAAPVTAGNLSKQSIDKAISGAEAATGELKKQLTGLGKPNTSAGQQAKQAITQLSSELQSGVGTIKNATSSAVGLSEVSTITGTLATMGGQISSTVATIKKLSGQGELAAAFENASSCKSLAKQSPV